MNKYSGHSGTSTANQDLYQVIKTNEAWSGYVPLREISFIPTSNCNVKVNGGRSIPLLADVGFMTSATQITSFVVVEASIPYIMAYRF